jgi:hypothetical protein
VFVERKVKEDKIVDKIEIRDFVELKLMCLWREEKEDKKS